MIEKAKKWGHDQLAHDLAEHLRASGDVFAWENLQMGASGSVRPDVWTLLKSYRNPCSLAYEVKISVSDFRSDATSGKWQNYLAFSRAVYFAVPEGLITKADVPPRCGLIVRHAEKWRVALKPTFQVQPLIDADVWLKLLMDGTQREEKRTELRARELNDWRTAESVRRKYGAELARTLSNRDDALRELERQRLMAAAGLDTARQISDSIIKGAHDAAAHIRSEANQTLSELCKMLGIPPTATMYTIHDTMHHVRARLTESGEVRALQQSLANIRRALREAEFPTETAAPAPIELDHFLAGGGVE